MQMKIKEKIIAVVMAFAMMFTCIFAGESNEVIAAAKTKALEINVDFARNAASGDDSGICLLYTSGDNVFFHGIFVAYHRHGVRKYFGSFFLAFAVF